MICRHRSTTINPALREQRLQSFITPIAQSWQDPNLIKSLETFQGFCDLAGVGRVQQYLVSRQVHKIQDWSAYQLDDEGKSIQAEMNDKLQVRLHLITRVIFLMVGTAPTSKIDKVIPRSIYRKDLERFSAIRNGHGPLAEHCTYYAS